MAEHLHGDTYDDTTYSPWEKPTLQWLVSGGTTTHTLNPGDPVCLDTSVTDGSQVVQGTDALEGLFVGIYTGVGGSGTETTSPISGFITAQGDRVQVVTKGITTARCFAAATTSAGVGKIAVGDHITVGAARFQTLGAVSGTVVDDGVRALGVFLSGSTTASTTAETVCIF